MSVKIKSIILVVFSLFLVFGLSIFAWFKPQTEISLSERRELKGFPEFSLQSVFSGEFMSNFEGYTADQFPFRDNFRTVKALFSTEVLNRLDNNGLFTADGHISKIEYPKNDYMLNYSAEHFRSIYDRYMKDKDMNIYLSVVPDKNFILAENNGYPKIDYKAFAEEMQNKLDFMKYIDVTGFLSLDDYYTTDSHWKQEKITDIAYYIATQMGTDIKDKYKIETVTDNFYGVYAGQSALNPKPDSLKYLTNDTLKNAVVTYYDNGMPKAGNMYDMDKAQGKDPYEMFLSGTKPFITIENENAKTDKELLLFRDSFGSSIAPLFVTGYKKVTVIDTRYINSGFLGNFIEFDNQDVLFLYSTVLLNNSLAMK